MPADITFAISIHTSNPLPKCLFKLPTAAESGNPAASAAAWNSVALPRWERRVNSEILDERWVDAGARRGGVLEPAYAALGEGRL